MPASPLERILAHYRVTSQTQKEKGSYFEELIRTYFRYEASYADLYSDVWLFADWAREIGTPQFGISAKDTGIDLVAKTRGTEEYHAIQCKCYKSDYRVVKADIDSFFTASGKNCFTQRIIVATTNDWSANAENALSSQNPPVYKIDLHDLELSQIDWAKYQPSQPPASIQRQDQGRPRLRQSGSWQAHHGLRHRQDLHLPQDRGGERGSLVANFPADTNTGIATAPSFLLTCPKFSPLCDSPRH